MAKNILPPFIQGYRLRFRRTVYRLIPAFQIPVQQKFQVKRNRIFLTDSFVHIHDVLAICPLNGNGVHTRKKRNKPFFRCVAANHKRCLIASLRKRACARRLARCACIYSAVSRFKGIPLRMVCRTDAGLQNMRAVECLCHLHLNAAFSRSRLQSHCIPVRQLCRVASVTVLRHCCLVGRPHSICQAAVFFIRISSEIDRFSLFHIIGSDGERLR